MCKVQIILERFCYAYVENGHIEVKNYYTDKMS